MTTSVLTKETKPNPLRVAAAWGVHLFTATGAVWGLLSILAIFEGDYRKMIFWIVIAVLVDALDGALARLADVKKYANGIDGALLDNILDYLNYVLVPALFIIKADIIPENLRLLGACSILLTSAYQFTQVDAKTDTHEFKGFPSYWNVAVLYMLLMRLPAWVNFSLLMALNVLVFIPIKYIYPSRNTYLKTLTNVLTWIYAVVGIWGILQYPNQPDWVVWSSFIYVAYYIGLSLVPKNKLNAD